MIFWGKCLLAGGKLSLFADNIFTFRVNQNIWMDSVESTKKYLMSHIPPPLVWQCLDFESACHPKPLRKWLKKDIPV